MSTSVNTTLISCTAKAVPPLRTSEGTDRTGSVELHFQEIRQTNPDLPMIGDADILQITQNMRFVRNLGLRDLSACRLQSSFCAHYPLAQGAA